MILIVRLEKSTYNDRIMRDHESCQYFICESPHSIDAVGSI